MNGPFQKETGTGSTDPDLERYYLVLIWLNPATGNNYLLV